MGDSGQCRNVANFRQWIGRRFYKEQFGIGPDSRFPFFRIGERDKSRLQAPALKNIAKQLHRGAENAARSHDVIACRAQTHDAGQDCRHTGRGRHTELRFFQSRQLVLEHGHGRVRETRIDIPRLLPAESGCRLRRTVKYKARRQKHRLRVFAEFGMFATGPYTQSFRMPLIAHCVAFPN